MKNVLALSAVLLLAPVLGASSDQQQQNDVSTGARGADRVVVGTISDVHSSFARNKYGDHLIKSTVVLDVSETLKGAKASLLTVEIEGGTIGDLTLRVSDMPEVQRGERAVFFLEQSGPDLYVPHRRGMGVLKLDANDRLKGSDLTLPAVREIVAAASRQPLPGGAR